MALWPFKLIWPGGLVNNQVPTHGNLNDLDEQQAQAADGAAWTDVAMLRNLFAAVATTAVSGANIASLVWDAYTKRWMAFGDSGGDPTGKHSIDGGVWAALDLGGGAATWSASGAGASDGAGHIIIGGKTAADNKKIWRTATGGIPLGSWAEASTVANGSQKVVSAAWLPFASLFVIGLDSSATTNIETSPTGQTWTQRTAPNALARGPIAVGPNIAVMLSTASTDKCLTTTDGVNWTERTLPASTNWRSVAYNARAGKFIAVSGTGGANGIAISSDGITWTSVGVTYPSVISPDPATNIIAMGRLWVLKAYVDLFYSLDNGATWVPMASAVGQLYAGSQQLALTSTGNLVARSLRGGY